MSILGDWITKQTIGKGDDEKAMGGRLAHEWELTKGRLEGLTPNDPEAEAVLRSASDLLSSITVNYGPIASWSLVQHHVIFRTANRVFGTGQLLFNKPEWTEQF